MTRTDRAMVEKNLDLIFEFERYVSEHPAFAKKIPDDAMLVFQVKGDAAFNEWSRRVGEKQAKQQRNSIVQITISKMGPVRSRIASLKLERAA
jgi:hypothetical protein